MPFFRVVGLAIAKTFSKLFGLATITFFGRLPSRDDDKVGAIGLISISWLVVLAAIVFPPIGELIFPFLDDEDVIRVLAIVLGIVLPLIVGALVHSVHNREDEHSARTLARDLIFGYGYAAIIGGLVAVLVLVVPIVKASYILRLFDLKHLAVMIRLDDYEETLEQIRGALARHGLETRVERPHWSIYWIFRGLSWIEGRIFRREVADQMHIVRGDIPNGDTFEVTLHATDISVLGSKKATSFVMAILAEELDEEHVYFSWDDASQELEDRIRAAQQRVYEDGEPTEDEEIDAICAELRELELSSEEWNAIRRQLFKLEAACLRCRTEDGQPQAGRRGGQATMVTDSSSEPEDSSSASASASPSSPRT
jgi:hypothetical protein